MAASPTKHTRHTIDCDRIPDFTAAYLRIAGDECAFIEAHTSHAVPRLMATLEARGKKPEDVRWVVVTHAHLDHAAGASALLAACPRATLLAHPRAAKNLIKPEKLIAGATAVYGAERFATLYGTIDPIPEERVRSLADNETFELGDATLRVLHTAGHAFHHFVVDDPKTETVYTGDSFGLVYPGLQKKTRFAIPSTSPTGFHAAEARKSLDRILALNEPTACPTHFGEVTGLEEIATQLRHWIDLSDEWVQEASKTDDPLPSLEASIATKLRAALAADATARGLTFGTPEWELLALDIELNAQGLAYVADEKRRKSA